jgi:hypothetical protein
MVDGIIYYDDEITDKDIKKGKRERPILNCISVIKRNKTVYNFYSFAELYNFLDSFDIVYCNKRMFNLLYSAFKERNLINPKPTRKWEKVKNEKGEIIEKHYKRNGYHDITSWCDKELLFELDNGCKIGWQYYYIGSDELTPYEAANNIRDFTYYNSGYSKRQKELLTPICYKRQCFCLNNFLYSTPHTPLMYSASNIDWEDVHCYDQTSAYIYHYCEELPTNCKANIDGSLFDKRGYVNFVRFKITYLVAKNKNYLPLGLAADCKDKGYKEKNLILAKGTRVLGAKQISFCGFYEEEYPILERNYNWKEIQIIPIAYFKLEINEELRNFLLSLFEEKQKLKRKDLDYSGQKQLLNRFHGHNFSKGLDRTFTKSNPKKNETEEERKERIEHNAMAYLKPPTEAAIYIMSKQRRILDEMAHKIGFNNLVHIHTDSLKFTGNFSHLIDEYNKGIEFKELGRFVSEGLMKKVHYYSITKAKMIDSNGNLQLKYGGIKKRDILLFKVMNTYDTIKDDSPIVITCEEKFVEKNNRIFIDSKTSTITWTAIFAELKEE